MAIRGYNALIVGLLSCDWFFGYKPLWYLDNNGFFGNEHVYG
jgi:hypothetical protein